MKKTMIVLAGSLLVLSGSLRAATEPVGMVASLQGSATATGADGVDRALLVQSDVFLNDTLRTPAASRLQILFSDDSIFSVGENSEVTIDEYLFNPDQPQDNAFGARLGRGVFRTVTGRITEMNPDRFSVQTSRATIGIRGCDIAFEVLPNEDRIFAFYIPPGRSIFVEPLEGDPRREIVRPSVVIVDDQGRIQIRDLQSEDRSRIQGAVTPANGVSAIDDDESDDAIAAVDPATDGQEGPVDGDLGEGDLGLDDTVAQDTNQPADDQAERLLTGAEIDQIIAHTQVYSLSGTGAATATVESSEHGFSPQSFVLTGPATIDVSIGGGGPAYFSTSMNLENGTGQYLRFGTNLVQFDGSSDLALYDESQISWLNMQTNQGGREWVRNDLDLVSADGELYGTGGNAPPTAARFVNGHLEFIDHGDEAVVYFETEKIELR